MYTDSQLALRNNVVPLRTSPVRDEAHATNHSGAEPSSVSHPHPSSSAQSAGFGSPVPLPLYSRMKPSSNTGVENGATIPQQQQHHPQQEVLMASAHALARYHISRKAHFLIHITDFLLFSVQTSAAPIRQLSVEVIC
jgi:hypothetical protein